ncbi:hypothetical protein [Chryseobacterium sp.]|uniref:hypothetical protein n=1 Tax=Chryseobacterium sp. TaxID=1871047 RepID=UPI002FCB5DB6
MEKFIINTNYYLDRKIDAYYFGIHENWKNTEVGFLNTLKNDEDVFKNENRQKEFNFTLNEAKNKVINILNTDLPLLNQIYKQKLTICVVPRSKPTHMYSNYQLKFIEAIKDYVNVNKEFYNGTDYIQRTVETPSTHITRDYSSVTIGITKETCTISDEVSGKDILLVDDLYTETVNIIEDAVQALFDSGAKSVVLYTIGKTTH